MNVLATLKYFIDIPFVTAEFNRRFLGEAREQHYRQVSDMRAFGVFWSLVLIGGGYWGGTRFWWLSFCIGCSRTARSPKFSFAFAGRSNTVMCLILTIRISTRGRISCTP